MDIVPLLLPAFPIMEVDTKFYRLKISRAER